MLFAVHDDVKRMQVEGLVLGSTALGVQDYPHLLISVSMGVYRLP